MASDPTFRSYDSSQAASYASARLSYPTALYNVILKHHTSTGGDLGTLLDVGCGPGNATRDLSPHFQHATGIDPGEQMIRAAQGLGGTTANGANIQFKVSGAEDIAKVAGVEEASVDLITAAMAAHWFDMPAFWYGAARVLKPGGTVALWTQASLYCHPSTPNAQRVQRHLSILESSELGPFELPPNRLSRNLYRDLVLPWTLAPALQSFPETQFTRREWDVDGNLSDGQNFFGGGQDRSLSELEKGLGTASMVTRWREVNADKVGSEQDCVRATMSKIRDAMGLGPRDDPVIKTGGATALLLFKKV